MNLYSMRKSLGTLLLLMAAVVPSTAATHVVTNTADSGAGSVRAALAAAAAGDTLDMTGVSGSIVLTSPLVVNKHINFVGPGSAQLALSGNDATQIMHVAPATVVSVSGVTFTDGFAYYYGTTMFGGAIFSGAGANMTVTDCVFTANNAYAGGAIFRDPSGYVSVTNCTFTGNSGNLGACIFSVGAGTLVATNSRFLGNTGGYCGGIDLSHDNSLQGGSATITNCEFSSNTGFAGAIINDNGNITVTNSTFAGNTGNDWSAAINNRGVMTMKNSILWGNTPAQIVNDQNFRGTYTVSYSNVQGGCVGTGNIDSDPRFVRNPDLAAGDFGNLRLQADSPSIDAADTSVVTAPPFLTSAGGTIIDLDGNPRVVDGSWGGGAAVDMGAYEIATPSAPAPREGVEGLIDDVRSLVEAGAILPGSGRSLYAKLDAAIAALDAGDTALAIQKLQDFISQVNAFVQTGKLTSAQAQPLIDEATRIMNLLGA